MKRPLVFGELLFDVFPGGRALLGGAPFNVARHLRGLGLDPIMVTRVGDDERGREALAAMQAWGMDTAGVGVDFDRPTGEVIVTLASGQPSYAIVPDRACDRIRAEGFEGAASVFYHGTLSLRSAESRATWRALVARVDAPRFVDVNLREPWWRVIDVDAALRGARWIKVNEDEATELWKGDAAGALDRYGAEAIVVTRGERGASIVTHDTRFQAPAAVVERFVDAVGAGDAFAAVVIAGLLAGRGWPEILHDAAKFAARVCGVAGALGLSEEDYGRFR